jgi:predicted HTH transcriptional regulator
VLVFHIPPRPRGTAYHLDGAYLMRAGEELVPMSEDQLRRIFAEGGPDWLEEPSKQKLDAQQVVDLLNTQAFFELLGLPYPTSRDGVLERLTQEQLIDRESGGYSIRRMAAILLAKQLSAFDALIRKATRMVVYSGVSKVETRLDRTFDRGYAVGFRDMVGQVMGQLPQSEVIEKGLRRERILVPEIAVRELVANALIHQDFTISGMSVMIEIYADRVEISSPGDPLVPVDRFIDGYQARNERLAGFMRRFAICEEKSSGVDKVIQTIEAHQLPAPDFHPAFRRTEAVLWGPKPFEDMDSADRVRACYQHCCLLWVTKQRMTNQTLRERFQLPEQKAAAVSRVIAVAVEQGLIKPDEGAGASKKHARYRPWWG